MRAENRKSPRPDGVSGKIETRQSVSGRTFGQKSWVAIRAALAALPKTYPTTLRRVQPLTNAELAEAERIERQGKRRVWLLCIFRAERYRRAGKPEKMLRLKMETNL